MKLLVFGSCNLDCTYAVDHIVSNGETMMAKGLQLFPGGKGLNQAIALRKAGAECFFAGCIGTDGLMLRSVLQEAGVDTTFLKVTEEKTGQAIIQVDKNGSNAILCYAGANHAVTEEQMDEVLAHFGRDDYLLIQNEMNGIRLLIHKAAERRMKVVLNPSPFTGDLKDLDYRQLFAVILNETEAFQWTGLDRPEEVLDFAKERYPELKVMLTLGEKGSILLSDGIVTRQKAFKTEAVDTTAAGDTFTGYFLNGIACGEAAKTVLRRASMASAIAVSRKGASVSIPPYDEVERYLSEGSLAEAEGMRKPALSCPAKPDHPVDVVLDTDTYNEIDDQFALAYLLKNEDKLRLKSVLAAPFLNARVKTPEEGMERSYREIMNVLKLTKREDLMTSVCRGSTRFLPDESTPVESEAADRIIALAKTHTSEDPLYVIAIAAITNVASALLKDPSILDRIVVIWLGGHAIEEPVNDEFNCRQDVAAARVVFQSGVPLVLLPCNGVVSEFWTDETELRARMSNHNQLCDYLMNAVIDHAKERGKAPGWKKQIWDVTAVAWLLNGEFMHDRVEKAPLPEYDNTWKTGVLDHEIRYVDRIECSRLFDDLFTKLAEE